MPNALARRSDRDRFGLLGTQERHRPSIRTYRDASLGAQRMANPSWIRQLVPTKPYVPRRVRAAADGYSFEDFDRLLKMIYSGFTFARARFVHRAGTPAPCGKVSTPSGITTHGSFDCVQI